LHRHFEPTPRLAEMQAALSVTGVGEARAVTAGLDISDGLAGDAAHLARRSAVAVEIESARLPLSGHARHVAQDAAAQGLEVSALEWALRGGEDYELLLAVKAESAAAVCAAIAEATSTPATIVGHCVPCTASATPVVLVTANGEREDAVGAWQHF
jgi:thiamine-monophosphate kinase